VTEDPATGVRRVEVERVGVDPKTKAPVTGTVKKTIYPKELTPAQIDQAGELALKSAVAKEPGAKLDPYGTKLKAGRAPCRRLLRSDREGRIATSRREDPGLVQGDLGRRKGDYLPRARQQQDLADGRATGLLTCQIHRIWPNVRSDIPLETKVLLRAGAWS
jgi:hypothetical protein